LEAPPATWVQGTNVIDKLSLAPLSGPAFALDDERGRCPDPELLLELQWVRTPRSEGARDVELGLWPWSITEVRSALTWVEYELALGAGPAPGVGSAY